MDSNHTALLQSIREPVEPAEPLGRMSLMPTTCRRLAPLLTDPVIVILQASYFLLESRQVFC